MMRTLADIKPSVRGALERFVREILARQGDNVVRIVLFGSVARGDDNDNSDVDVFLLMKKYSRMGKIGEDIISSASEADDMNNYDTYTAPFTLSIEDYVDRERVGLPIVKNIKEEGIVLYDTSK